VNVRLPVDLHPSLPPKDLRAKVMGGMALVLVIVVFNYVGPRLWPHHAQFFPPSLLLILVFVTACYALFVWRTEWMAAKLFPGQPMPPVRPGDRIAVWISFSLTVVLLVLWIRSLVAS
jgi:hypothetical protein